MGRSWLSAKPPSGALLHLSSQQRLQPTLCWQPVPAKPAWNDCVSSKLQTSFASSVSETAATSELLQSRLNLQGQVITWGVFFVSCGIQESLRQDSFPFPHPNPISAFQQDKGGCCCVLQQSPQHLFGTPGARKALRSPSPQAQQTRAA